MDLKELFLGGMESTAAHEAILSILEKYEGQEISYELVIKIRPQIANRKDHAEVIFDAGVLRAAWKDGFLMIGKSGFPINIEKIRKKNRETFRGIEDRNKLRKEALESEDFDAFAKMLEMFAYYTKMAREMERSIKAGMEDGPFSVERAGIWRIVEEEVERLMASGKNLGSPLASPEPTE